MVYSEARDENLAGARLRGFFGFSKAMEPF
jgi:hypothetical protein